MSLRQEKVVLLKNQQKDLMNVKSSPEVLHMQQKALRCGLLINKPKVKSREVKANELREMQVINRSMKLKRERKLRKKEEIIRKIKAPKIEGLFFPRKNKRR